MSEGRQLVSPNEKVMYVFLFLMTGVFIWCLWQLTKEDRCIEVIIVPPRPDPLPDWDGGLERLLSGSSVQ